VSAEFRARALGLRLGEFTLGPLDLEVMRGEYLVLVGPSGAGKTVLLETLLGWHSPGSGDVLLDSRPVAAIAPAARGIAYVPQDLGLLPHLGVRENLLLWPTCRGQAADPDLLRSVVGALGIEPLLDRRDPRTLSRGEQQRVALGRALLARPARLLLDEPCAALDPHLRRDLQILLRQLHAELGTTVIHVTHDREEAFLLGQRVAVLLGGHIRQVAAPRELYLRPADAAVARFLAPENLWPARVVAPAPAARVRLEGHGLELEVPIEGAEAGRSVLAGIRPEEVMILHPDRPLRPQVQGNVIEATIRELLLLDGRVQVELRSGALRVACRLPFCAAEDLGLREGGEVRASLKPRSMYVVPDR